jgi:hypothetical protein
MNVDSAKLVKAYIAMRDARAKLEAEFNDKDNEIKAQMESIEAELLETCKDIGADSIKTEFGTVTRSVKERYWATDWHEVYDFIRANECPEILEKRLHQGNYKAMLLEHPEEAIPGVQVAREFSVTVRRSSSK